MDERKIFLNRSRNGLQRGLQNHSCGVRFLGGLPIGEVSLMVMGTAWKAVGSGEQLGCGSIPHFSAMEDEPDRRAGAASKADGSFDERGWVSSTPSSASDTSGLSFQRS